MEADRRKVPLYGQVEAHVTLQGGAPSEAEFFVVLRGSKLSHVTAAQREDELKLSYTVPGHDVTEVVSVTSYFLTKHQVQPCGPQTSLEYVKDVAYEAAERLSAIRDRLVPDSCLEVLKRFSIVGADEGLDHEVGHVGGDAATLKLMDEKVTLAVASMDYPPRWSDPQDDDTVYITESRISSGCWTCEACVLVTLSHCPGLLSRH